MFKVTRVIEDSAHQAICLKAAETNQSMFDLDNASLEVSLKEDFQDLKSLEERKTKNLFR